MPKPVTALAASLLLAACSGSSSGVVHSPSPFTGGLTQGLIAFVAPLPPGAFRVAGPVWAPAPGLSHPVLYFTVHDDRPAESRTAAGVVPYDWLFRVDPFVGTIDAVAASHDSQSEGPIGLVANSHYLGLT